MCEKAGRAGTLTKGGRIRGGGAKAAARRGANMVTGRNAGRGKAGGPTRGGARAAARGR